MEHYHYYCNTRIEMGMGKAEKISAFIQELNIGRSILLVSDPGIVKIGLITPIKENLVKSGYRVVLFEALSQNPRDIECLAGAKLFKEHKIDAIVAVGGGSAMDTGKAIALLGSNGGVPMDYIEGIRSYNNIAPIICIPTTAGTGSEVTRSSVITEASTHRKLTLKHASLRPILALLDPKLTMTVPQAVTAATGVDALVHAIEGYTCKVTNPISQALGAKAMQIIVTSLPIVYQDEENEMARYQMLEGSLLAGLCFGSADVAAVHCLAEALGGLYDTPHGVANAVFLPYVLKFNAVGKKQIHATLSKYMKFATESDSDDVAVEKLIKGIQTFTKGLKIPRLKDLPGVRRKDFPKLVELAMKNSSTASNVRLVTSDDYLEIIQQAYDQHELSM